MKDDKKYKQMEKEAEKPAVIFSFDGTVMDTEPAILATYRYLYDLYGKGLEFTKEKELEVLDSDIAEVARRDFPQLDERKVISEYETYQRYHLINLIQPMKDIQELLEWLRKKGYKTAIVSSRNRAGIVDLLEHAQMIGYFDVIIGSKQNGDEAGGMNSLMQACELLGVQRCIYVGDSAAEIRNAKKYGAFTVGFVSNRDKSREIVEEGPDFATADLLQIKKLLKSEALWLAYMMQDPDTSAIPADTKKKKDK